MTAPHRMSSTLPSSTSPTLSDDGSRLSSLDIHQQGPEPFQSMAAQELLKDNCSKCGWIRKEGGSFKSWRDRYVILHKGCLYYYNSSDAKTIAGKFSLSGYRLSPAPEKSSKFPWTFKLVHLQPEKRTYYFAAYSEKEMNEWMDSIASDMSEYCGTERQNITEPTDTGEEYWYPEVEPKFDKQQLAAMFGKPPSEPTSDAMYCPPPEMDPQQVQRRSPRLQRPAFPLPKPAPVKGFSYTGSTEGNRVPGLGLGAPSLGAGRHPFQGSSPLFPRQPTDPPAVPTRKGKPLPPPKPLPRPPPLAKHVTEPILKYTPCQYEDPDEEEGEGYLDIVPDTNPQDVKDEGKQSTLSRGFPDGRSFRQHHYEGVLPSSAVKLDMDKMQVTSILENKLGVYILRRSQNAQSERALSVWTGDRVRHYMLFYDEKGFALDPEGARFGKIEDLIRHFYDFTLPKCDVKLTRPYK